MGGGAIGVSLYGLLGGYALSGRGPRWARIASGAVAPFGRTHPASRSRVAGKYGILKIVPNYPSLGRWVQAFKTTAGQTLDRVPMRCH